MKNLFEEPTQQEELQSILKADKTFGITVSGDVLLNKLEVSIVNSQQFQRLRRVKQLGSTYLVYPSAIHTRFEHSLGVLKEAETIVNLIKLNHHNSKEERTISEEEHQIVRLLALLHDIGHMPFGHTIEDEFSIFSSHDKHETRWEYFLGKYSEIGKIIIKHRGEEFHSLFFKLIKCEKQFHKYDLGRYAFLYDIVSNTVCADLLDYLCRDCLYTNLKLSHHPRFLNFFFILEREVTINNKKHKERRIGIRAYKTNKRTELRRDILSELVQLLRNRYYLGERVYYHHAKIMTGTLIAGAVLRAETANSFDQLRITDKTMQTAIENNSDKPEEKILYNIHNMGDEELVIFLKQLSKKSKNSEQIKLIEGAIKLATKFENRELYKEHIFKDKNSLGIDNEDVNKLNEGKRAEHPIANKIHERLIKRGSASQRLQLEEDICEYLDINSGDVLIYCPNFNMAMKLAKAIIETNNQNLEELKSCTPEVKKECDAIIDKHQALWALRVYVHKSCYVQDDTGLNEVKRSLITKYFDWQIFSKNTVEEKSKGKIFWESYFQFFAEKNENKLKLEIDKLDAYTKRKKVNELCDEFISMTSGTRKIKDIRKRIFNKFNVQ